MAQTWAVGQRAEIYIATGRKHAVPLLPSGLVVWHESHPGVFIDSDGRASWRDVTLGARSRDMVEVVEGLRPGDTVVVPTDAAAKLEAGRRIARDDARPLKAFGATTP